MNMKMLFTGKFPFSHRIKTIATSYLTVIQIKHEEQFIHITWHGNFETQSSYRTGKKLLKNSHCKKASRAFNNSSDCLHSDNRRVPPSIPGITFTILLPYKSIKKTSITIAYPISKSQKDSNFDHLQGRLQQRTHFRQEKWSLFLVEIWGESEITLKDDVREARERPPAHKQPINQ